jgi:tRNA 2-thiouridine synthesizing protein A
MALNSDDTPEATALIAVLDRLRGGRCYDCQSPYRGSDALFSIALGFKDAPRCLSCLANGLKRDRHELAQQLYEFVQRRDCYRQAREYAARRDEQCALSLANRSRAPADSDPPVGAIDGPVGSDFEEWNAGDMSCGDLVLALRVRLSHMLPGSVLKIIATDPAAPEDLPSWCRMTGHKLLDYRHPEYYIRRKEN